MRLVWTEDLPAKPGWYWMRTGLDGSLAVEHVTVTLGRLGLRGDPLSEFEYLKPKWSGPIPEPSEPKQEEGAGGG